MNLRIIIVNYNTSYFINQTIKSVLSSDLNLEYEIIVIDNNSIAEVGDHNNLINQNGIYKKLWDIQTGKLI